MNSNPNVCISNLKLLMIRFQVLKGIKTKRFFIGIKPFQYS